MGCRMSLTPYPSPWTELAQLFCKDSEDPRPLPRKEFLALLLKILERSFTPSVAGRLRRAKRIWTISPRRLRAQP